MLTLQCLREERDRVISALAKRHVDAAATVDQILELDAQRRATQTELDQVLAESNALSRQIGGLMREGKKEEAEGIKAQTAGLKDKSNALKEAMDTAEHQLNELVGPVAQHPLRPRGRRQVGGRQRGSVPQRRTPSAGGHAKPHWDIAKEFDLIDFDLGAKVTGAGFPFYKGKGAKLQRGLIRFFLERADEAGYTEYIPPHVVNADSGYGTGQLPDKEGQMYHMQDDDLYMIPTAEVPSDQHLPRCGPERKRPASKTLRIHAVLPSRSRQLRQGRPWPEPPAPVRQSGDCASGPPRRQLCHA